MTLEAQKQTDDPIKHVVVLMLENRSFDQMLGSFQQRYPQLNGIDPNAVPRENVDHEGITHKQLPNAKHVIPNDPHHDLASVLRQIGAPPAKPGNDPNKCVLSRWLSALRNADVVGWIRKLLQARRDRNRVRMLAQPEYAGYFVAEYSRTYPESTSEERQQVMSYFDIGSLPALHTLAEHFTICDNWYSSLPGPTWANRFFFHTGTTRGTTWMPESAADIQSIKLFDQRTIYDELTAAGQTWKIYFHDFPQSLALSKLWTKKSKANFSIMEEFEKDVQRPPDDFPNFVFIEPQYMGDNANDDHPPHDSMLAQDLIAKVYNGIRANEELWKTTLLVITYDEHGGFFDHVNPPAAIAPDNYLIEYSFDQLGVRVPTLLVSPWVQRGVWSAPLDHTSVGKYLCEKWGLDPLGKRMIQAASLRDAICTNGIPRIDTPSSVTSTSVEPASTVFRATSTSTQNENQRAIQALADYLTSTEPSTSMTHENVFSAQSSTNDPEKVKRQALSFLR